jgi:hypothetical protein
VGRLVPYTELKNTRNGKLLTAELFQLVHALAAKAITSNDRKPA